MYIEIDKELYVNKILPHLHEESPIIEQAKKKLRYGATSFDLDVTKLDWIDFDGLYSIAKIIEDRSLLGRIATVRNLLLDLNTGKVPNLKAFATGLVAYIATDRIDGWLYKAINGRVVNPYLVRSITYEASRGRDEPAYVLLKLEANTPPRHKSSSSTSEIKVTFYADDVAKRTIPEILMKAGYFHENAELKEIYEQGLSLFTEYQPMFGKQFWAQGHIKEDYSDSSIPRAKVINDEGVIRRRFKDTVDPTFWRDRSEATSFDQLPFHCYIYAFNLSTHEHNWVHVSGMEPYVYDHSLRDKLVLPQDQRDLIDILVSDLSILQGDIIEGKSGGTTILCQGAPGLGKTLSAEVYSEVVEKPLYKVHSGQLGLSAESVRGNLEATLKRAERWGAVLLLDEADVYIRSRGNDIEHNAVVAEFLRTLEYFSGLLFMTTNRVNDVDEALLSRCIAVINYTTPSVTDAQRIWRVLADQLGVSLPDPFINDLVGKYPHLSGRDIKELLKLTARFAKGKGLELNLDLFVKCAQFRGV